MAYVPVSEEPSAYIIGIKSGTVLLDLLGTYVLLDGGAEKVAFTNHIRQVDTNVISGPTKDALTNAVEMNKESIVPVVGNIPVLKSDGSDGSIKSLLKQIKRQSEKHHIPIVAMKYSIKYEPIVISKSLRTGRLELYVLAGDAKEIDLLEKSLENADEQTVEKLAATNGTISLLVWYPAKLNEKIKRVLHTGTASFSRIVSTLEKAKGLSLLHISDLTTESVNKPAIVSRIAVRPTTMTTKVSTVRPSGTTRLAPTKSTASSKSAASRLSGVGLRLSTSKSSVAPPKSDTSSTKASPVTTSTRKILHRPTTGDATPKSSTCNTTRKTVITEDLIPNKTMKTPRDSRSAVLSAKPSPCTTSTTIAEHSSPIMVAKGPVILEEKITNTDLDNSIIIIEDVPDVVVNQVEPEETVIAQVELIVIPPTPEPSKDGEHLCSLVDVASVNQTRKADEVLPDLSVSPIHFSCEDDKENQPQEQITAVQNREIGSVQTSEQNILEEVRSVSLYEEEINGNMDSSSSTYDNCLNGQDVSADEPHAYLEPLFPIVDPNDSIVTPEIVSEPVVDHPISSYHVLPNHMEQVTPLVGPSTDLNVKQDSMKSEPIPEEFKIPHTPQPVGDNGLLDDLEEPQKLMKISMDTEDLKKVLETSNTAFSIKSSDNISVESDYEKARKISQQMIDEAATPFTAGFASTFVEEANKKSTGSPLDELLGFGIPPLGVTDEGIKDVGDSTNHKMKAMQTRSSIVGQDAESEQEVKYEQGSDPVLDGVLELVADHSELVDRTLSNGTRESKEKNGNVQEVTDRDFSTATDSHGQKLFLLPPATRRSKALSTPRLSRALFFELVTVPHQGGKCTLVDEAAATEYFTNIRSSTYILHSNDVAMFILNAWLNGKKMWLNNGQKTRLIPTVHHTNLQAFKTENAKQLEEYNMELSGPLESQITTINGEDQGKIEYHMIKISL